MREGADVTVTIYSATGQLVRRLDLGYKNAGVYTSMEKAVHWDGTNEHGERVSSGLYFYTIQAGEFAAAKKMIVTDRSVVLPVLMSRRWLLACSA